MKKIFDWIDDRYNDLRWFWIFNSGKLIGIMLIIFGFLGLFWLITGLDLQPIYLSREEV